MKIYPLVSELPYLNRQHLAWRLDMKTGCGLLTALRIAKLKTEDLPLNEVFEKAGGLSPHAAKIHATKTINFKLKKGIQL